MSLSARVYVPEDWRQCIVRGGVLPELTRGAALFADISGFTPLTEALTRAFGPRRGSEHLSHHLNSVFDSLIAEVNHYGGSVVSFAGDAITCWFAQEMPEGHESAPALRAIAAALAMQRRMRQFATISIADQPPVSLAVKIAVATGPAHRFAVGDPDIQLIPVLAGGTLARMAAGEHLADKGEVLVDEATLSYSGQAVDPREWRTDEETGSRFAVVERLFDEVAPVPWPPLDQRVGDDSLRRWVLPAIYRQLQAGLGEFITELRPAVALFLRFGGIDFDSDREAGFKLDAFARWVQRVAATFDGTLLLLAFGDKGSYLYMTFGAPIAHEDDARRAVSAALDLRVPPADLGFIKGVQIGISSGTMIAGAYGASTRRTYGTLGDEVNLAARLMQGAPPGEVLVSQQVYQAACRDFTWESLAPVRVKGKSEPIAIHRLLDACRDGGIRLQEPRYALPIVGRQRELAIIGEKLEQASQGIGQIVGITAEAGLGKSRLVAEVVGMARAQGLEGYAGECQSYGTNSPYLVWRSIWQAVFCRDPASPLDEQLRSIEERLKAIDPSLVARLPLLGVLLGLHIPDNDLTASFDAKLRKTSLEALLVDCLRARVGERRTLLVLEDCHWLDPLSEDLLATIARSINSLPLLLLLAYRPPAGGTGRSPLRDLSSLTNFTEIGLVDLEPQEVERLVALKLQRTMGGEVEVPPLLIERVTARAQGNPFYIEELLNFLDDRGIDPRDPRALESLDLPTSLHSLILSRIDQVSESQKLTLKVASIVGRLFRFRWLWGVHPELGSPDRVKIDLEGLGRLDITSLDQPEPELSYLFKHIVTQEVAYESQPYALRTVLHDHLGQFIEHTYPGTVEQFLDLLAFHYDRTENLPKRREYLRKAGEAAQAAYANASAIDYFRRVLPLLGDREQVDVRLRLGQVLDLVGEWQEAEAHYEHALGLAEVLGDNQAQALAQRAIGWLLRKRGDFVPARDWLVKARASFEKAGDSAGVSEVLSDIGETHRLRGMFVEAQSCFQESLTQAKTVADSRQLLAAQSQALKGLGIVASQQGDHHRSRSFFEQALANQRELGSKPGIHPLLNNLAIVAGRLGELDVARQLYEECLALLRELGDRWAIAISLNNKGFMLTDRREYAAARVALEEGLTIARQLGQEQQISVALNSLAQLCLDEGTYTGARRLLEESLTISARLHYRLEIASALASLGSLAAAEGQPERAFRLSGASDALRQSMGMSIQPNDRRRFDRLLEPARELLGPEAVEALWAEGKAMSMEEAIAYALSQVEDRLGR